MKTRNILLTAMAWMGCAMGINAQEYLHINSPAGEHCYPLEEIVRITIEDAVSLTDKMEKDENITLFTSALKATGIDKQLTLDVDYNYDASQYPVYYYKSDTHKEIAVVPTHKMSAYTLFIETDEVLRNKYGVTDLEGLKALAKRIYDSTYPADAGLYDDDVTHPKNPLYRFVAYHILTRDILSLDRLTGRRFNIEGEIGTIGIREEKMNPIDWYQTLLPNTLMKCEILTVKKWVGENSTLNNYYLNRRWDDNYQIRGSEVSESQHETEVINGRYFYADDLVAFTQDVRDKVQNMLIRMDVSTIFPELTSLGIRLNGNPLRHETQADEEFKYGKNYYFPNGSLDGLKVNHHGEVVYRRSCISYCVHQGDDMIAFGDYDIEIKLPPVPFSGEWQIRLGYYVTDTRGVAQIYLDGEKQGEPIDLRISLDDESLLGSSFHEKDYYDLTIEEKVAEQKFLKEKGFYRGPAGVYYGFGRYQFENLANTPRRVLCQTYMDSSVEHTLRIQYTLSITGYNTEFMLDYIELVPKSVYNVPEGEMESDL